MPFSPRFIAIFATSSALPGLTIIRLWGGKSIFLNLSETEVDQVVEFLKTLTGSNINQLILDAKAAPIGDISLKDPNWFHENKPKY